MGLKIPIQVNGRSVKISQSVRWQNACCRNHLGARFGPFGVCIYHCQKQESVDPADSREWLRLVKTSWSGVNKVSETGKLYSNRKVLDSLVWPQLSQVL